MNIRAVVFNLKRTPGICAEGEGYVKTSDNACKIGRKTLFREKHRICKICGFNGGDYEECRLLVCYAVWLL
jgi:hypothetical protein